MKKLTWEEMQKVMETQARLAESRDWALIDPDGEMDYESYKELNKCFD